MEEKEPHALEVDQEEAPPPQEKDSAQKQRAVGFRLTGSACFSNPFFSISFSFFSI